MIVRRNIIYTIILFLAFLSLPVSCVINEFADDPILAEGKSSVSFDVEFRPLVSVGAQTRTEGDAIKHIESLWVVVYKTDGSIFSKTNVYPYGNTNTYNYANSEQNTSDINLTAPEGSSGFAEEKYCHSTFKMDLPLGKYRIYAVANYDLSSFNGTEDELKSIKLTWNAADISANNPMFGYFTDNDVNIIPSEAPVISVNKTNKSLHAWVKRAASKVTVSFDGSNLYENVYIYIHTVQIKDIPNTCWLGKDNTPASADQLIAEGETVSYRTTSTETDGLRITKGVPYGGLDVSDNAGGVHHENANSLFFFENRQPDTSTEKGKHQDADGNGKIDNPDGSLSTDPDFKDGVPYGSYIEVKGYYVNKTAANASQGPIVYRFMLGKDTERNCDAERSNHYKLVLRFNKDANNTDWHIEYEPENPEISVASPLYISYIHHEKVDIPVVIRGGTATTLTAEITENNWAFPGHKYEGRFDNGANGSLDEGLYNGFLSLEKTTPTTADNAGRYDDFYSANEKTYQPVLIESGSNTYHYNVPAYTRALVLGNAFSGNNVYVDKERTAKIKFTATVNNQIVTKEIEIIQVRRLVNPAGVWRPYDSVKPFHVVLTETINETSDTEFHKIDSDGPWTAEIVEGDWFSLSSDGISYGENKITGSTGSNIDFYYKPSGTCSENESRFGVIKVLYHNNTCVHYFFVSQGLAPVSMGASGTQWHMTNVHYSAKDEPNPLCEGSMFRWGRSKGAILSTNNKKSGYGFGEIAINKPFTVLNNSGELQTAYWPNVDLNQSESGFTHSGDGDISVYAEGFTNSTMNSNGRPPEKAEWDELETLRRYYGVLYGEDSEETLTNLNDVYGYYGYDDNNNVIAENKGMRGMFVWDDTRHAHLFFPIGATGHGHRKHYDDVAYSDILKTKFCVLRYAQRHEEMPANHKYGTAINIPLLWDLYVRPGAIYWYRTLATGDSDGNSWAHDINYFTFDFNTYGANPVYRSNNVLLHSDAAYIRRVEP